MFELGFDHANQSILSKWVCSIVEIVCIIVDLHFYPPNISNSYMGGPKSLPRYCLQKLAALTKKSCHNSMLREQILLMQWALRENQMYHPQMLTFGWILLLEGEHSTHQQDSCWTAMPKCASSFVPDHHWCTGMHAVLYYLFAVMSLLFSFVTLFRLHLGSQDKCYAQKWHHKLRSISTFGLAVPWESENSSVTATWTWSTSPPPPHRICTSLNGMNHITMSNSELSSTDFTHIMNRTLVRSTYELCDICMMKFNLAMRMILYYNH